MKFHYKPLDPVKIQIREVFREVIIAVADQDIGDSSAINVFDAVYRVTSVQIYVNPEAVRKNVFFVLVSVTDTLDK